MTARYTTSVTKNPFINALAAAIYIVIVASIMYYGPMVTGQTKTILVPITMISLFTLSAAVMGYLFLYQPFQFYLGGEKKHAVTLFLYTVAVFAVITVLILLVLFSRILSWVPFDIGNGIT